MRSLFILIFIIFSIVLFGQEEKRLALVIGNANYDKGALKNPISDADLMKVTFITNYFALFLFKNIFWNVLFIIYLNVPLNYFDLYIYSINV